MPSLGHCCPGLLSITACGRCRCPVRLIMAHLGRDPGPVNPSWGAAVGACHVDPVNHGRLVDSRTWMVTAMFWSSPSPSTARDNDTCRESAHISPTLPLPASASNIAPGADRDLAGLRVDVETGRVAVAFGGSVRVRVIVLCHPRWPGRDGIPQRVGEHFYIRRVVEGRHRRADAGSRRRVLGMNLSVCLELYPCSRRPGIPSVPSVLWSGNWGRSLLVDWCPSAPDRPTPLPRSCPAFTPALVHVSHRHPQVLAQVVIGRPVGHFSRKGSGMSVKGPVLESELAHCHDSHWPGRRPGR